jgi:hypothetical protein
MADLFDEVVSTDVFDEIESPSVDARGRRRVEILGEMADVERERAANDQRLEMLEWSDRPLVPPGVVEAGLDIGGFPRSLPGVRESVARTGAAMSTPLNVAMLSAGGAGSAIPRFGGAVARGVAGGFGVDMARHIPETATQLGAEYGTATPEEKQRIITDLATSVALPAAALAGAMPRARALPPRIPEVMNASEAAANRAAVNLAAPGTVRATERMEVGPPRPDLAAPEFQLGDVPFDRARRFGGTELPPVEILPQSGRLPPIEILEELRTPVERETRGKVSFGAEAPTLLRNAPEIPPETALAIELAREAGLSRSAQAAAESARKAEPEAPVIEQAPETPAYASTEAAWERGMQSQTPEGIAALESELAGARERLREAISSKVAPEPFLKQKQLAREALEVAQGKTAPAVQEWLSRDPLREIEALTGTSGTAKAYEVGAKIKTPEQLAQLKQLSERLERENLEAISKAETDADLAAISDSTQRGALVKEALESALGLGYNQKFDKTKISLEEYNRRMASDTPIVMEAPDLVSKLEALKIDPRSGLPAGQTFSLPHPDAIKIIGKQVWNDALDLAIAAVKAGRAVGEAIESALQHLRKNVRDFESASLPKHIRENLEYVVSNETKPTAFAPAPGAPSPAPAPAPRPTPSAPGGTPPPPTSPPSPPVPSPGAPPPAPSGGSRVSLDDVYKRFELDPKKGPTVGERIVKAAEAFRTGFSSKFRPLNKLAEDIANTYGGTPKDVAAVFEQLKGSSGKAEADVYRFDREVADVVKGNERDFNAYMFLRRSLDRLAQDAASGETRRKVSGYTAPDLQAKLAQLESGLAPETLTKFQAAADAYQTHLDAALQQQVTSGRMPIEVYEAIKDGNQFYAPFKIMKWVEDSRPEGSGRRVDTTADYTKAMEGVEDPNFKLGDMLAAGRQNIAMSRILAEKNIAMQHLAELAPLDTTGTFIQRLSAQSDPPRGMETINVMENGQVIRYAVEPSVAQAIQMMGPQSGYLVARMMGGLFRAGATSFNLPFQVSNLLADVPRQALVSRYGINAATDIVRYPMDMIQAIYSSVSGNVFGNKNQLFLDYLDSGAAGTTVQRYLTPDALEFQAGERGWFENSLNTVGKLSDAIEQTSKILGVKRAMREENIGTGKSLARFVPEAITEIRRFSGSPDFGRMGKWVDQYRLNLLYMFLNARLQGTIADVGRLTGRDGASTAAKTWGKVGVSVGIPTAYLYWLNHSDGYRDDYAKRPEQEKRNYWLIPKDTFITGNDGERMRDYWRIPKREIAKWTANALESGLDFARERDPQALADWGTTMAEELIPVNVQGETAQERLESVGASLNPMVKAPLELATGRDMYRHRDIVPERQKKASPEQQYTDRTAEVFKSLAETMPDVAPEVFRSPLMLENMTKNLTAGLFTQFLPRKPVEGRTPLENQPLLQRFQAVPYTDSTEFDERISQFERESADDQLNRYRTAQKIFDENKSAKPDVLVRKVIAAHGSDEKLAERVIDLYVAHQNGITPQERRVLNLPVEQRATYIARELEGKDAASKTAYIRSLAAKRILTSGVAEAMVKQGVSVK